MIVWLDVNLICLQIGDSSLVLCPIGPTYQYSPIHWYHWSNTLETAFCTAHRFYNPLVLLSNGSTAIGPTHQGEYAVGFIGPMAHWSYDPKVRRPLDPTNWSAGHAWANGPATPWFYDSIVRRFSVPTSPLDFSGFRKRTHCKHNEIWISGI